MIALSNSLLLSTIPSLHFTSGNSLKSSKFAFLFMGFGLYVVIWCFCCTLYGNFEYDVLISWYLGLIYPLYSYIELRYSIIWRLFQELCFLIYWFLALMGFTWAESGKVRAQIIFPRPHLFRITMVNGVWASAHAPQLILWDICHLPMTTDSVR